MASYLVHVHTDGLPFWAHLSGGKEHIEARAAAEIDHGLSLLKEGVSRLPYPGDKYR
jgi:hypothetical protein